MTMQFDQELDARGLKCPLPILRCKKGIATLAPLQVLKIVATDAGAVKDFQAFCKQTGHEMLSFEEVDSVTPKEYLFFIRKRAA